MKRDTKRSRAAATSKPIAPAPTQAKSTQIKSSQTSTLSRWVPRSTLWLVVLGTLTSAAIVLFFFTPRFTLWRCLDYKIGLFNPEVIRAVDIVKQLDAPFKPVDNLTTNRVLRWRILFPMLGYYAGLPRNVYLALPALGALLTLAMIFYELLIHTSRWIVALAGTVLMATTGWFFVSIGWLGFFDSWYMLSLCIVLFARSSWVLASCCLATPWIDERFVISLPVTLLARGLLREELLPRPSKNFIRTCVLCMSIAALYALLRVVLILTGIDESSGTYIGHAKEHAGSALTVVEGLWNGMRLAWIPVGFFFWYACRTQHWVLSALVVVGSIATLAVQLFLANDLSRSASTIMPLALSGVLLAARDMDRASVFRWILALAVGNLFLPAAHIVTLFKIPIRYLYTEIDNYFAPPAYLTADFYIQRGSALSQQGQYDPASAEFAAALRFDPKNAIVFNNLGVMETHRKNPHAAEANFTEAIKFAPESPDAYFNRAQVRRSLGDYAGAYQDTVAALAVAPQEWASRVAAELQRDSLREKIGQ